MTQVTSEPTDFLAGQFSILCPQSPNIQYSLYECINKDALGDLNQAINGFILGYAFDDDSIFVIEAKQAQERFEAAVDPECDGNY